jgi:hypothetical protein
MNIDNLCNNQTWALTINVPLGLVMLLGLLLTDPYHFFITDGTIYVEADVVAKDTHAEDSMPAQTFADKAEASLHGCAPYLGTRR